MTKVGWSDFVVWQCSLRQRNFRMFSGKPSEGTLANISDIKSKKVICEIRSVLIEKKCINTAKMFEFIIKQTHEPELRFDKAIKFLAAEYYNTPVNFDGSFTATFDYKSKIIKKLINKKLIVQFFERETGFYFHVNVFKLTKNDPRWKYTFSHNLFFNPYLNENIVILHFTPIKKELKQIH